MESAMEEIRFNLNGSPTTVSCRPDTPLIWVLRDQLGQKSVRYGCGQEQCGSCTVIRDGTACYSCTMNAGDIPGAEIETAEGLVEGESVHPLVDAFEKHQAGQCGYCLPGILMRTKAHFDSGGPSDHDSLTGLLDSNLCRCGAHLRILSAVKMFADHCESGGS